MTSAVAHPAREGRLARPSRARVALVAGAALPVGLVLTALEPPGQDWRLTPGLVVLSLCGWAPLLLLRLPLLVAPALAMTVEVLRLVFVPPEPPLPFTAIPVATLVAVYFVATRAGWRVSWVTGGVVAAVLLGVSVGTRHVGGLAAASFQVELVLAATGAGLVTASRWARLTAMEGRAVLAEQTRRDESRRQVAAERVRIARELHDVLAHNLTLVNAQAAVAAYLLHTDPDRAETALHDITHHTRQALDELRATVGLLRQDDDAPGGGGGVDALRPVPGLDGLDGLLAGFATVGIDVTVTVTGTPHPLSAHTDLAAYRILQEALTNASKHAPAAAVRVTLTWTAHHLDLLVVNDALPAARRGHRGTGTGHGLVGMRERALAAGGSFVAGSRPDGSFAVTASLAAGSDATGAGPHTSAAAAGPAATGPAGPTRQEHRS